MPLWYQRSSGPRLFRSDSTAAYEVLKWATAVLLIGLGVFRPVRSRHISYGGMRVDARELATWSFLLASAHGAGLMVVPLVMGDVPAAGHGHHVAASMIGLAGILWSGIMHRGIPAGDRSDRGDRVRAGGTSVPAEGVGEGDMPSHLSLLTYHF